MAVYCSLEKPELSGCSPFTGALIYFARSRAVMVVPALLLPRAPPESAGFEQAVKKKRVMINRNMLYECLLNVCWGGKDIRHFIHALASGGIIT